MHSNDLFKLLFICFFICVSINHTSALNRKNNSIKEKVPGDLQEPDVLSMGVYLIIGVFEYEKNAQKFATKALDEGLEAKYSIHSENGFFYVYTYSDSSKEDMLQVYHYIRNKTQYNDAWILTVEHNSQAIDHQEESFAGQNINDEQSYALVAAQKSQSETQSASLHNTHQMVVAFDVVNQEDKTPLYADIQIIDGNRARLIEKINTHQTWNYSKNIAFDTIQVIAQAIGYRKLQMDWSIADLLNDSTNTFTKIQNDTLHIQFPLMKLETGDIQVMYNTYFYGNSTVMRIQSKFELEEVFKILKESPNMSIRLHGHTNGNSRGLTYLYLEEKKNFFELVRTKEYRKKGVSASKLSTYRAETIKSYLVHRGIDPERIEAVGWGGEKILFDPDSPMAKNNIRVEIEVLRK